MSDSGPVEEQKDSIRDEPFSLPSNFEWSLISLEDVAQVSCWWGGPGIVLLCMLRGGT